MAVADGRSTWSLGVTVRVLSWLLLGVVCSACAEHKEVARIPAPSRDVDAVVVEGNGGATTSFWYDVYLTKPGAEYRSGNQVADTYGSLRRNGDWGVDVSWRTSSDLVVEYKSADRTSLDVRELAIAGRKIAITLRQECPDSGSPHDSSAPNT
jgi:hypothetical protein